MTALRSMIRVQGWVLEEKRRNLAEIQVFADKLKSDLSALDDSIEAEREAAGSSDEVGLTYPAFVAAALDRRKQAEAETIGKLENQIDAAREEVAEAFQQLKAYEMAQENQERREAAGRDRAERIAQDELGVSLYRRNKRSERLGASRRHPV